MHVLLPGLHDDRRAGRRAGFGFRSGGFHGKAAIHPRQVDTINRAFAPAPEELERARRLIALSHGGARALDGHMVDEAMIRAARRLLARCGDSQL